MNLKQTLIDDLQTECAARRRSIELASGRIAEAEALAETLVAHGLPAKAFGAGSYIRHNGSGQVHVGVRIERIPADHLLLGLRHAELRISALWNPRAPYVQIHLDGLDVPLETDLSHAEISAAACLLSLKLGPAPASLTRQAA